jgi:hypothetical protein
LTPVPGLADGDSVKLDQIDWAALSHAYGSAQDIPELIRALDSTDPTLRRHAQERLEVGPFHQGTHYSCLPEMVSLLVERIATTDGTDRVWILRYLATITPVRSWYASPRLEDIPPIIRDTVRAQRRASAPVAYRVLARTAEHLDTYLNCLRDSDERVRAAAAGLCVRFEQERHRVLPRLVAQFSSESSRSVKAVLAYALGAVATPELRQQMESIVVGQHAEGLVRAAAAFGLFASLGARNQRSVVAAAAGVINARPHLIEELERLFEGPLAGFSPRARLLSALEELPRACAALFIPGLTDRFEHAASGHLHYLDVLEAIAFGGMEVADSARADDLSDEQLNILNALFRRQKARADRSFHSVGGIETESADDTKSFLSGGRVARPSA